MTDKTVSHAIERGIYSCSPIAGFAETSRAAGNHLIVDMGNSQYALYAHLKPYSVTLQVGDVVTEGQKLGLLGNTGNTTGPLLLPPSVLHAAQPPVAIDGASVQVAAVPGTACVNGCTLQS